MNGAWKVGGRVIRQSVLKISLLRIRQRFCCWYIVNSRDGDEKRMIKGKK